MDQHESEGADALGNRQHPGPERSSTSSTGQVNDDGRNQKDEPGTQADRKPRKGKLWQGSKHRSTSRVSGPSVGGSSFVTAHETSVEDSEGTATKGSKDKSKRNEQDESRQLLSPTDQQNTQTSTATNSLALMNSSNGGSSGTGPHGQSDSTASLIPHGQSDGNNFLETKASPFGKSGRPQARLTESSRDIATSSRADRRSSSVVLPKANPASSGLVRFNIPEKIIPERLPSKTGLAHLSRSRSLRRLRKGKLSPGAIVKMEKMLVRVDSSIQQIAEDYSERDSLKTESRIVDKWKEFMVVCRESRDQDADFTVQMYKTRVIPEVEKDNVSRRPAHEISLKRKFTKVNLYSTLDKTVVIWLPWKSGTRIYILRPRSLASSVEWYTFLRYALGWKRARSLQINVPDLSVTLQLDNPFEDLEASRDAMHGASSDDAAIMRMMDAEKAVASTIINRCVKMLKESSEWGDVLETWMKHEKIGLAWKRYDRLEWVHGANEQKMYGTLAMQQSHDLELRPKHHYPTKVHIIGETPLEEPAPVEGFLIRLTSQRGVDQRFGRMFYKRLYFSTHNQFLCFCRPAKALPPPPPKLPMTAQSKIPSVKEIVDQVPLIYAIKPFPTDGEHITWLNDEDPLATKHHDLEAYDEAERVFNTLLGAEGYINLCHVTKVRNIQRGASPADQDIDQGSDVDFHEEVVDTARDDGAVKKFDDERTFEMVLKNGLVVRLQAYDQTTKREWMDRLRKLSKYWKLRVAEDSKLMKNVRQSNLDRLKIDEENESFVGQFASKWEVTRSEASPRLYNMCGISCCRAITVSTFAPFILSLLTFFKMSGVLYRKPKLHSTFIRCGVILCHGNLLIFQGSLRTRTGREVPHIHHERQSAIDLRECYLYSGLVTDSDLLYQNQTFDSNHPGHHALPRIYLEDSWTSTDEDTATCFVIWHGKKRSFFKANEAEEGGKTRQRLRYVSRLGVTGRSIVFKTRSRAERDQWVLSIGMEIERLQQAEEFRLVSGK